MNTTKTALKARSPFAESMRRLIHNKTAMMGFGILLAVTLLCLFANVICPEGYNSQDILERFKQPGSGYLLGTDELGRSMLARLLYGGRTSLMVGFISTGISAFFGIILGSTAAFYGGNVDNVIMRTLDVFNAIPNLLMAIAISSALGPGIMNAMIAVGISAVPGFARTVRGPILAIKESEFVEAARSIDARDSRIIFKHILPNVLSPIIVQISMGLAQAILVASSLSFLGLGVQAPVPEWGAMLSASRQYMREYPYLVTIPGLAIASVVLSMNLFGDGLRDALDPRLKN